MQSTTDTALKTLRRDRELLAIALERTALCEALLIENERLSKAAKQTQTAAPASSATQPTAPVAEQE